MKRQPPTAAARRDAAEQVAIAALAFLAGRPDDLARFLAESGADPASLRASAGDPGFLGGVLDHVLRDDALVLGLAAELGVPPERIGAARHILDGAG